MSHINTIEELRDEYRNNYVDLLDKGDLTQTLKEIAPDRSDQLEVVNPISGVLAQEGVFLRSDLDNGVRATPLKEVLNKDRPHLMPAFKFATHEYIVNNVRGVTQSPSAMEQLNSGLGDYNPGSAMRPYSDSPLRDGDIKTAYPPVTSVAASVIRQNSDSIRVATADKNPNLQEISETADIPLREVKEVENTAAMARFGDGLKLSAKMVNSGRYTTEMVMLAANDFRIGVENEMAKRACVAAAAGLTATTLGTTPTPNSLLRIVGTPNNSYRITTGFGRLATVQTYLGIDRSSFFHSSDNATPLGSTIGNDAYARAAQTRLIYDVPNDYGIAANQMLFIDATEAVDVYILEGSDRATDTYKDLSRTYEIAWDIEFGVILRTPTSTNGRYLFSFS